MLQAGAHEAITEGAVPPFHLRPALVGEMLELYDELRRRQRQVDDFERLLGEELEPRACESIAARSACCARRGSSSPHSARTSGGCARRMPSTSTHFATGCSRSRVPARYRRLVVAVGDRADRSRWTLAGRRGPACPRRRRRAHRRRGDRGAARGRLPRAHPRSAAGHRRGAGSPTAPRRSRIARWSSPRRHQPALHQPRPRGGARGRGATHQGAASRVAARCARGSIVPPSCSPGRCRTSMWRAACSTPPRALPV